MQPTKKGFISNWSSRSINKSTDGLTIRCDCWEGLSVLFCFPFPLFSRMYSNREYFLGVYNLFPSDVRLARCSGMLNTI